MSSFTERLLKHTTNPHAYLLKEDKMVIRDYIDTGNVALNCQISADPFRGVPAGRITQFAGPESVGKSIIAIQIVKNAQKNGYTILYYDTEGAQNRENLTSQGIDDETLIHSPITSIRELQTDILSILDEVKKTEKLLIVIDSIGMLGSNKQFEDARAGKHKQDMTKQKELKSLFVTITGLSAIKMVPIIVANHTYDDITSMYGGQVVSGGKGSKFSSSTIVSITKSQDKDDKTKKILGSYATCTAIKSRLAKEKTKVKILINFAKGIEKYSGLFDIALELGIITVPKQGWYTYEGAGKNFRKKELDTDAKFWDTALNGKFGDMLRQEFKYQSVAISIDEPTKETETEDVLGEIDLSEE